MTGAPPLILDTDIGGDVDDALALAFALRHPDIQLRAVTTVSGDTRIRAFIAAKLLALAQQDDIEVAAGLGDAETGAQRAWMGHEGKGLLEPGEELPLSPRDAVTVLTEGCRESGDEPRCEVATIGGQTNIAAALRRDGGFARNVARMFVMGGVFAPVRARGRSAPPSIDYNLNADRAASVSALSAGLPILYVPINVTVGAYLLRHHLDRLRAGDDLCRALARLVDVWAPILQRLGADMVPEDCVAVLHDPLTVACTRSEELVRSGLVTTEVLPVTVAVHDGSLRTFVDPAAGHPSEVVTSVDGSAFADLWLETVLGDR